ncbi:MAG: GMP/IMP nucleotidase [Gammaproteobacteria bacterium]|nr:GMP/IMP nucleotidase [Gammaproteobacteria bacterium]
MKPTHALNWSALDTVLLDMDGTLLDLHFDNHFWLEHLPARYAEIHGLPHEEARDALVSRFAAKQGTLDWYCVDYWSRDLGLDIAALKRETMARIAVLPHALDFLDAVRGSGRKAYLVTNAHHKSLALKLERTGLDRHLDGVLSAHSLGRPKEDPAFWPDLRARLDFEPARTLFCDDSLAVLQAARAYGIAEVLAIAWPDSQKPPRPVEGFPAIADFSALLPGLLAAERRP